MPKPTSERIRLINFDGADGDFLYFSVASSSTKDVRYDLTICKREYVANCTCRDAYFRRKEWRLLEGDQQNLCKHLRSFRRFVQPRLEALGAI